MTEPKRRRRPSRTARVAVNAATLLLGVAIGASIVGRRLPFLTAPAAAEASPSVLALASAPLLPPARVASPIDLDTFPAEEDGAEAPASVTEIELTEEDGEETAAALPIAETREVRATAYCLRGRTRTGVRTRDGVMAADPEVLPLGSVVRIVRGGEPVGIFVVLDTGRAVKGDRVDLWMPDCGAARRWGVRTVTAEVVELGRQ